MNISKDIADLHDSAASPVLIRRVDPIAIRIPLAKPMKMAHATFTEVENLVVRIEAEDGTVGWGEAASAPSLTGETWQGMVAVVRDYMAPVLAGQDARLRGRLSRLLDKAVYGASGSRSAVEMALIDLVARSNGVPAALLLGGLYRDRVEPMWMLGNPTAAEDVAEAERRKQEGYRFLKLKAGAKRLEDEIELALAVRRAVGPEVKLCADANSGFTLASGRRYLEATLDAGLAFLEQPFPARELRMLADLARGQPVPLCADQSVHTTDDIHRQAEHGVGGIALKLNKLGGVSACLHAAELCEQEGLRTLVAAKVAETSIASAAIVHLACAVPNVDWGVSLTHSYLAHDVVREPLSVRNGGIMLPPGPGWGVEIDEGVIARIRID